MGYKPNPKRPPYSMSGLRPSNWGGGVTGGTIVVHQEDNRPTETLAAEKGYANWLAVMACIRSGRMSE